MDASLVFKILKSAFFATSVAPMQTDIIVITALKTFIANGEYPLIVGIFMCMLASLIVDYIVGVGFRLLIVFISPKIYNLLCALRGLLGLRGLGVGSLGSKKYNEASRVFTFLCIPFVALFSIASGIIPAMIVMLCGIMSTNVWVALLCCIIGCFGTMASFILL